MPRYRYGWQWADGSFAHYLKSRGEGILSNCGRFYKNNLPGVANFQLACSFTANADYLCELVGEENLATKQDEQRTSGQSILMPVLSSSTASFPVPTVVCPAKHFTHSFIACDPDNKCWPLSNNYVETLTMAREVPLDVPCEADGLTSFLALMACDSGVQHVPYSLVCDHQQQCDDGSDESFCIFPPCSKQKPVKCMKSAQVCNFFLGEYDFV